MAQNCEQLIINAVRKLFHSARNHTDSRAMRHWCEKHKNKKRCPSAATIASAARRQEQEANRIFKSYDACVRRRGGRR